MDDPKDGDLRARYSYSEHFDAHIVVVEQFEHTKSVGSWRVITNLFVKAESVGRRLARAITENGRDAS